MKKRKVIWQSIWFSNWLGSNMESS